MTLLDLMCSDYTPLEVFAMLLSRRISQQTYDDFMVWWVGKAAECASGEDEQPGVTRETRERR